MIVSLFLADWLSRV